VKLALVARLTETRKHFVMRGRGAFLARLAARRRAEACQVGTRTSGGARVWTPRARAATHARECRSAEDPPMTTFTRRSHLRDDAARRGFASAASSPPPPTKPDDPEMQRVVEIEEGSHLQDIVTRATQSDVGLVFDFYADWCGPCKTLTPMLEDAVMKAPPRTKKDGTVTGPSVVLVKINVDKHAGISDELRIKSLPTIMTMRGGAVVDSVTGTMSQTEADALVAAAAANAPDPEHHSPSDDVPSVGSSGVDPCDLVDRAFELLNAPGSFASAGAAAAAAAAAADAVNAALAAGAALPPAAKARAYAAAARCALLARPPDVAGAGAMVASARQVVGGNFPEPEEIAAAEALARLTERAAEAGRVFFPPRDDEDADAEGASSSVIPTSESLRAKLEALEALDAEAETRETRNAKGGDDDSKHPLRRALAAVLALEGNAGAAVAAALAATRKSKTGSPDREAARATCVAVFDAFGQKHPESVAGKRKLANLWFV